MVRLDLLVEEVLQYMRPLAAAKRLELVVDMPADMPRVEGDREKLFRVLINLVDNAVKFSDKGRIIISARQEGDEIGLAIADSGQGVLPENRERIFERFFQEKTRYQGVGVGLTISRAILENHGGRIWVESPGRGGGATFRFRLPLAGGWRTEK
jgi:signal transduction histidine kinase